MSKFWSTIIDGFYQKSLRVRYVLISIAIALVIVLAAVVGQVLIVDLDKQAELDIDGRIRITESANILRNNVWRMRVSLENFLLEPNIDRYIENFTLAYSHAHDQTVHMSEDTWIDEEHLGEVVLLMRTELEQLHREVVNLFAIRRDALQQYPTLFIASRTMQPLFSNYATAASLAVQEMREDGSYTEESEMYFIFNEARVTWYRMGSIYRMYLANGLASFDKASLPQQEADVELLMEKIQTALTTLDGFREQGKLGIQAEESLDEMKRAASAWMKSFHEVVDLRKESRWRQDAILLKEKIKPHFEKIWHSMMTLQIKTDSTVEGDINYFKLLSIMQSRTSWIISILLIAFIALGYVLLNRALLNPISRLGQALKQIASGEDVVDLPEQTTTETNDLIDAFNEMQKQVKSRQKLLEYQATHDALTQLPNRSLMQERLNQMVKSARRNSHNPTVFIMDLDLFKEVNDSLGHHAGDLLLCEVGKRIGECLRDMDTVARLGGDEFAVVTENITYEGVIVVAKKVLNALAEPFQIEDKTIHIGISIGVAVYPHHGETSTDLIRHADTAMYEAKKHKLGFQVYDEELDSDRIQAFNLISDLKQAIAEDKLELYFQPKIDVKTGDVLAAEALLRWKHPEQGFINPEQIVAVAEQNGMMNDLTVWVLGRAIKTCAIWQSKSYRVGVAVNVSAHNIHRGMLTSQISEVLEKYNAQAEDLILEITESAMMNNPDNALEVLNEINDMGVRLSIDDFGTGFSSLSYLKKLPVSELKIDRSFVMDIRHDESDEHIVRSTIDLAHNMGMRVTAEGIEDENILGILAAMGCDEGQGYHICRPIPVGEFIEWLEKNYKNGQRVSNS